MPTDYHNKQISIIFSTVIMRKLNFRKDRLSNLLKVIEAGSDRSINRI